MSLVFTELATSRPVEKSTEDATETLKWIAASSSSENAVYAGLFALSPKRFNGLNRRRLRVEPVGGGVWMCEAEYGAQAVVAGNETDNDTPQDPGNNPLGPEISFDTTGGTVHITQSKRTSQAVAVAFSGGLRVAGTNLTVDAANNLKVTPDGYTVGAGDVGKKVAITGGTNTSGTNLTVAAGDSSQVTPDGYTPVASDVGKTLTISGGAGFRLGTYGIVAVSGGSWFLNRGPALNGTSGGVWSLPKWALGAYTITAQGGGQWTLDKSPAATSTAGGTWGLLTTAPNYRQAIGVTTDGVEGTDITARKLEFTITGNWYPVTMAYVSALFRLTGTVNQNTWWGFSAGEVLYLGATGQCNDGKSFRITHKFAASPNLTNVVISSDLVLPTKGGWEYVWCAYEPSVDASFPVTVPRAVYSEQVYDFGNFSALGMG